MSTSILTAQSYLNFRGDVTADLSIGQVMGPTTYGGVMYVVGWEYDRQVDRTSVAMSAVKPTS